MDELKAACCAYKIMVCTLNSYFKEGKRDNDKFNNIIHERRLAFSSMMAIADKSTTEEKRKAGFYQTVSNIID